MAAMNKSLTAGFARHYPRKGKQTISAASLHATRNSGMKSDEQIPQFHIELKRSSQGYQSRSTYWLSKFYHLRLFPYALHSIYQQRPLR